MEWYYSAGGQQVGPVGDDEFQRLVQEGSVNAQTLVWKVGMAQWQPYGLTTMTSQVPDVRQAPASAVICASCGHSFSPGEVISLDGRSYCATCKPMVVQRLREGVTADSAAEETRKLHLSHESSVRSVGSLYLIGGVAMIFLGLVMLATGASGDNLFEAILFAAMFLILGGAQFWVGLSVRRLRRWSRIPVGIFSGIGLLGFPIGTIINGYILYLVFSEKGRMVFSDEYQAIVEQTPHIKQRTSIVVWIILGLLLMILVGIIVVALVGSR